MSTYHLIVQFVLPLVLTGLIHHFIIIRNNYFKFLAIPVDKNITFFGNPVFGSKKTWRGIIIVIFLNSIITLLIGKLFVNVTRLAIPAWIIGGITGIGYSLAELPTSFIKRRLDIVPSGQSSGTIGMLFYILDQSDSVLGSLFVLNICVSRISLIQNCTVAIVGIVIHVILDILLHKFGYKSTHAKPECIKKFVSP